MKAFSSIILFCLLALSGCRADQDDPRMLVYKVAVINRMAINQEAQVKLTMVEWWADSHGVIRFLAITHSTELTIDSAFRMQRVGLSRSHENSSDNSSDIALSEFSEYKELRYRSLKKSKVAAQQVEKYIQELNTDFDTAAFLQFLKQEE